MNFSLRSLAAAAAFAFLPMLAMRAQIIELRATINAAQEVPATASPATGTGRMLYDVASNRFDLFVTINNYANPVTDTHVQEGAPGENGPAQVHAGDEAVYTRTGNTISATFLNRPYPGDPMKLLRNGAYLNFHSGQFPRGEVRGQLITQPTRLVANFSVAQEQAAFPATAINATGSGAAVMLYDFGTNQMSLRLSLFGFNNTLTNSHYHEGTPGVSGPVVVQVGQLNNGTVTGYTASGGGWYAGNFDLSYTGDPIKLLNGGAYLNFHSNIYPNGELRGQVTLSTETATSRMINLSTRGFVGVAPQNLIGGLSINGPEPVRVLITAKGPSLTAFGVAGALADPVLTIFDASGRQIAANDNIGTIPAGSELSRIPGVPTNPNDSALVVVLPPGNYTAVVSGAGTATGIALLEAYDLRIVSGVTN